MEADLVLIADYANIEKSGKLNVMGIFREIGATSFPARHPEMHVVVALRASAAERGHTRKLSIRLIGEDGETVVDWSRLIDVPKGAGETQVNQILRLRDVVFPVQGEYSCHVLVDDDDKRETPITLKKL